MTNLLYLADTYLFTATATVERVEETEHGTAVILDQTICYPQGGGQPADHGALIKGDVQFAVDNVRLDPDGVVWHFGSFAGGELASGDEVEIQVDEERRTLHARIHSAGHLIDVAVTELGIPGLVPTKGYHFPEGPYVQYDGTLDDPSQYIAALEAKLAELVAADIAVEVIDLSSEEAQAQGIQAPPGKSARVVNFAGHPGCGCGGTHVRSTGEIGTVTIRKLSSKKGVTKVAYAVE